MASEDPDWSNFLQSVLMSVLEASDEGLIVFDGEGRCRMIGRRAGEMFGVEPAVYVGRARPEVLEAFAKSCEEPDALFQAAAAADGVIGVPTLPGDVDVVRPRPRTVLCKGMPILRVGARPGCVIFVRDVTRERAAERMTRQLKARLAELTPFDTITGLLNHKRFREELEREHGRCKRAWDSYAILRIDIDGMRDINDEYGVPVGDQILEQTAGRLKACLREYDVVSRLEDDEFGALLPGADAIAARAVADRMHKAMTRAFENGPKRWVTLSIGGAVWIPPSTDTSEETFKSAGEFMKEARREGGGKVAVKAPVAPAS